MQICLSEQVYATKRPVIGIGFKQMQAFHSKTSKKFLTIMAVKEILFTTNLFVLIVYIMYFFSLTKYFVEDFDCSIAWTAFIVPYRNRSAHLPQFVEAITKHQGGRNNYHFEIFVIEQDDERKFNRGKLLNVGAVYALAHLRKKCGPFRSQSNLCLILHDVDMLPLNQQIPYNCSQR